MTKPSYVYVHRRADNGDVFYVGCAVKQIAWNRRKDGCCRAYDFARRNEKWRLVHEQHGTIVDVVLHCDTEDEAFAAEMQLIAQYGRGNLTNLTDGGRGANGQHTSERTRKIRAANSTGEKSNMWGKTGALHHNSKPVINIQSGVFFDSITDAANALGYKKETMWAMLSGRRPNKTLWRFA